MSIETRTGHLGFNEFLELTREDEKADLLDGRLYMASPENIEHNELLGFLTELLGTYIRRHRAGRLLINKVAFRLSERTAPEPDLAFVRAAREHIVRPGYVDGPPDMALEIVSPESAERDYEEKRMRYETAQVLEYWIVDPGRKTCTFLELNPQGFAEVTPVDGVYASRAIPGFKLDTRWLWQRPLPDTFTIMQKMLQA